MFHLGFGRRFAGISLMALALGACAPFGPQSLRAGRPAYNEAVQQTEAQQLLLNIVRQRYNDPVMFLDVTSISSGASRQLTTSFLGKFIPDGRNEYSPSVGASMTETPVIFYAPNTGDKFVKQMLTPVDLRSVALVLQAGWSIERVLLLAGESVNRLSNNAASPEGLARFRQLAEALRELQRGGHLTFGMEAAKDGPQSVILVFAQTATALPAYRTACALMEVPCDGRALSLRQAFGGGGAESARAALATRSLISAMFFLAQGVDAPADHVRRGLVARTADSAVDREHLFHVRSAASEPDAVVKVLYRGSWFYLAEDDRDSKTTFALMSLLVTLQAGDVAKVTPLISLPAG